MITSDIIKDAQSFLMNTYSRQPLVLVKGRGTQVYDSEGREYLDFVTGVAVNNLGHCHPKVVVALQKQAQRLMHVSNHFHIEAQVALGKELVRNSFADKAFFCNSGTEAIEAAIKLSRRYSREVLKKDRFEVITMFGSFHGRTYGAVSATAQEKFHQGFEPMVPGFRYVPFNDSKAVEDAVNDRTCAILVEPLQGEGGVKVPAPGYLKALRKICDEHQLLLVLDEIQTGMGRTGRLFAYEHEGITPDIMALAKGLGSGMPIGALLATDKAAQAFVPGTHGSTFGGNPLACAVGLASLEALLEDNIIIQNVEALGMHFMSGLASLKAKYPFIKDVRGQGLLIGMELDFEGREIVTECLKQGFLINCTVNTVLRFMPPLIISEEEIDQLIDALDGIFKKR
jgi:predicted acetylornithine/succinylornithine family transaminase